MEPFDVHQVAEGRGYVNDKDTQRTLDMFSNVKAATVVSTVETTHAADAKDGNEEGNKKEDLAEVKLLVHYPSK